MIVSNLSVLSCRRTNSALCLSAVDGHLEASSSYRTLSPTGHLLVALCLGLIGSLGFLNNLLVLVLFCRYKVLRSPINFLLVNISFSDFLVCLLGTPFSFAASTQGRWLIGHSGCVWYGFANSLLGECVWKNDVFNIFLCMCDSLFRCHRRHYWITFRKIMTNKTISQNRRIIKMQICIQIYTICTFNNR